MTETNENEEEVEETITEEYTDLRLEQYLGKIFPLQQTIVLRSKNDLSLLFKNKMRVPLRNAFNDVVLRNPSSKTD